MSYLISNLVIFDLSVSLTGSQTDLSQGVAETTDTEDISEGMKLLGEGLIINNNSLLLKAFILYIFLDFFICCLST